MNEKELVEMEEEHNKIWDDGFEDIPALVNEVRRLRAVVAEYADHRNWQHWPISNTDLWIPDERGYTRAENALKDGE